MLQAELGFPAEALEGLEVAEPIPPMPAAALPPYNGYGTLDDSKQNCIALVPKPPKKVSEAAAAAAAAMLTLHRHFLHTAWEFTLKAASKAGLRHSCA